MIAVITQSNSHENLRRLFRSIERYWVPAPDIFVTVFGSVNIPTIDAVVRSKRFFEMQPLSLARNEIIRSFDLADNPRYTHFVFLDDDAWFEQPVRFNNLSEGKCYLGHAMSPEGRRLHSTNIESFYAAISINLIVSRNCLHEFDENLGLGSTGGAGEDWDYFLRLKPALEGWQNNYIVTHSSFLDKIKQLSLSQCWGLGRREAKSRNYILKKHELTDWVGFLKIAIKGLYPLRGVSYLVKNFSVFFYTVLRL